MERKNFPGSLWSPSSCKFLAFRPLRDTLLTPEQVLVVTYGNPNGFGVLAVNNPALPQTLELIPAWQEPQALGT